jgi:endonuclease YncB( thermonuclease family)
MLTIELPERPSRYWYKIRTKDIRVIDGVHIDATYRLASINAPEMKGKTLRAAKLAALRLAGLIENENYLWLKSLKNRGNDKQIQTFGRYVAYVFTEFGECLNVQMVAEGHAVPYMITIIEEDSFEVKK